MRVLIAVLSLWAVAVLALRGDKLYRFDEVDEREVEPFRAGKTFRYRLDTQISSGMASVSEQHSVTRLQAEAQLHFQSERLVTLRLKNPVLGTLNREISEPERVQPMEMFKEASMKSEETRLLELPCTFDYVDGLVERIRFHQEDKPWSKNVKKAALNMLQLNLKQRQGDKVELKQLPEWQKEREIETGLSKTEQESKTFVMPEITLEGECQVTYTMNKMNRRSNKFSSYYDNEMSGSRDEPKMFNVTKSVDFHRCNKIADIRYGPKIELPCDNCTDIQELEERKLDRTTVVRHIVVGNQEQYGIKKAQVVSHYMFKMLNVEEEHPMHTIVACELNYIRIEESRRDELEQGLRSVQTGQKEETLLYNTEWDENAKRFYMYGDEEFPINTSPFEKVQNKITTIDNLMKKLTGMWADKATGIESEATIIYSRIVELLRMCNMEEIQELFKKYAGRSSGSRLSEAEQLKAEDIIIDALANAGVHNTIKVLVEKILQREIQPVRAVRALVQLKDLPAPSEKIVEMVTRLCESESCNREESCKQVCWLSAGAIMGDLCDEKLTVDDALEQKKPVCHLQLRKDFVKKIMDKYNKEETRYGKILLLKALGNAGLDVSVNEIEKVIRDIREEPMVRMQAIDALRRLRAVMPQKIVRVLMPIYQNIRERPEVRMTALSLIMATFPEHAVIDQIGYTLMRDPSRQVKSYVYTTMKQLSTSPVEEEKELARHLKAFLKLADISEEDEETLLRGSRHYRIPVYSQNKREGLFADLKSMFGTDEVLPKHLGLNIQTVFNGLFLQNSLEVSFTQEDLEQWVEKMMDVYMDYYGELTTGSKKSPIRGNRNSRSDRNRETSEYDRDFLKSIKSLDIKKRQRSNRVVDSDSNTNNSPFGMLCLRYGDIDYAILPLEEELLPHCLKKIFIDGERPSIRDFENMGEYMQGRPFRAQAAMHLLENSVKIPTSAGFPVRMWHVIPVLASVEGSIKPRIGSELTAEIKLHPSVTVTHMKRIEVWTPIMITGVETTRTLATNLPLSGKLEVRTDSDDKKTFQLRMNVPEHNFRMLSIHTLPLTFVSEQDYIKTGNQVVKRIENTQLLQRAQHIEKTVGKENFGMSLKIHGEVHTPHRYNYEEILRTLMASENHLRVEFINSPEQPREIVLSGEARFFQQGSDETRRQHRELKGFYGKSKFDDEQDRYYEDETENDERQLTKFLDDYEPRKMYNHRIMLKIETVGSQKDKKAQMEIEADCDAELRYFKTRMNIQRSPLPSLDERREWTMKTEMQTLLPETISRVEKYEDKRRSTDKNQKFVCQINSEWGIDRKNTIRVNINGEQARNQIWREKIDEVERRTEQPKLREQMMRKVAFLNKFDITADARVEQSTKNFFNMLASYAKAWNFWSTSVEMKTGRDNQILATVVIDPMTHEHANITIKTPVEIIRMDSLHMPMKIKPFQLIKPGQSPRSIESFTELVSSYGYENRAECKVDSRKVRSFDDVVFKAPLTKCYSVLAKDCANTENPRFVVLMKKLTEQKKELKMVVNGDTFEIKPKKNDEDKLIVKINGREEDDYETLREYGIERTEEMVRINTRDISVRFDGETAWVKISQNYKNQQCGICGHYDDDGEDEWRMSNNENTRDLKSFHKSYSLVEDECRSDLEETHKREEYKPIEDSFERYERDNEYEQRRRRTNENDETEPIEKTEVMEYNHKICFSIKPVKTCPEGSYPKENKSMKVGFSCLDRTSSESRRLLREARRQDRPITLPRDNKPSFVETLTVPSTCGVY